MRHALTATAAIAIALTLASPAAAACYADYKAKRDNPLRLHYGVLELPQAVCGSPGAAEVIVRDRIAAGGWELLNVVGTFDASGLEERRANAAEFFLRF